LWDSTSHLIKTIYGTSTVTYGHTSDTPLYGLGQGSMCGPLFWLLCYWLIVESIDPTIKVATYVSACRSMFVKLKGVLRHDDALKAHIMKKANWTEISFAKVDWKAHKCDFNRLTRHQKITTAKLTH